MMVENTILKSENHDNNQNDIKHQNYKDVKDDEQEESSYFPIPIGQRIYTDNGESKDEMTFKEHILATLSLGIYTSWIYIIGILLCFFWFPPIFLFLLFLFTTIFLPAPLFWEDFLKLDLFRIWRKYFNFSFLCEEKLNTNKNYLFAEFPHGTFPLGPFLAGTMIPIMFPGKKIYSLAATILFRIPFYRHIMYWMGSLPATKKNLKNLMSKSSVAIVVGGIAEMFMQYESKEAILLSRRKGFIKSAIESGFDIVPVYHFGNSRIMSIGPRFLVTLCRKFQMSFGILVGRWKLPIPKKYPIYMVVGKPISIGSPLPSDSPEFEVKVEKIHEKVKSELKRIYYDNRDEFGWHTRPLVIF